ncbi:hypothetical protein SEA_LILYLOU_18 [Microbacterium phage LilyLou]|uniref:Uncharacterized protein n=1 Tax=Microbacterium phage LilyLou TaxID=2590876 RepID=A0A4Y6EBI6_9CAUD|nr:hypothetical protein SEA_LILYLOU_18 [Microbacterium phage LilyLou]
MSDKDKAQMEEMSNDLLESSISHFLTSNMAHQIAGVLTQLGYTKPEYQDKEAMLPINNTVLRWGDLSHSSADPDPIRDERPTTDIDHANIVCSDLDGFAGRGEFQHGYGPAHKVVFDIDWPIDVIQSSPGKGHLYIDKEMSWSTLIMLMAAFVEAGLMEPGFMYASIQRGYTSVRVPWALKNSGVIVPEPEDEVKKRRDRWES